MDFKNRDENGNFKSIRYHENYNFDLNEAISKQPIKELANEKNKEQLMESLKKGNRQSVTLVQGNTSAQFFVEANPKDRTINVYDAKLKRVSVKEELTEGQGKNQKKKKRRITAKRKA